MLYYLKENSHNFSPKKFKLFTGRELEYIVNFDDTCLYDLQSNDQLDINKLFGFSKGYHHSYSVRFGWRPVYEKIEILAYIYRNGKRVSEYEEDIHLGFIETNKFYKFKIQLKNGNANFIIKTENNELITLRSFPFSYKFNLGYLLNPYFGGNQKAPHEMFITLK